MISLIRMKGERQWLIQCCRSSGLFLEWSRAKVGVEPFTEDRDGLELGQICTCRYYIVLVALIAFKGPQINPLDICF